MADLNHGLPNINFFLHENQTKVLLQQLDEGKLDVLILPYLDEMEKFESYHLFNEPLFLATPKNHALSAKKDLSLSALDGEKILTLADDHCLKDQAMGYCFAAGAKEDNSFQATSLETLRRMGASGNVASDNISYSQFQQPQPVRGISLVIRPNYSRIQCVRAIVASVRKSIAKDVI